MSDRIAIMHEGEVLQVDDPIGIYERPTTRFGADFIGEMNFLDVVVESRKGEDLQIAGGGTSVSLQSESGNYVAGNTLSLAFRPEAARISDSEVSGTPELVQFGGTIEQVIYIGTDRRYEVKLNSGETVTARVQNTNDSRISIPGVGSHVAVCVSHSDIRLLRG